MRYRSAGAPTEQQRARGSRGVAPAIGPLRDNEMSASGSTERRNDPCCVCAGRRR